MFTHPAPSPPALALANTSSQAGPTSPRGSRLRGLSYLRNYTHTHLLSRDSSTGSNTSTRSAPPRSTQFPVSPASPPPGGRSTESNPSIAAPERTDSPGAQVSRPAAEPTDSRPQETPAASGWVPSVGGHTGTAGIVSEPQSSPPTFSSAEMARSRSQPGTETSTNMPRTRAGTFERSSAGMTVAEPVPGTHTRENTRTSSIGGKLPNEHLPSIRFTAHQDTGRETNRGPVRPSLVFHPMSRTLPTGREVIRVGRYSERDSPPTGVNPNVPSAAPVGFKSKVVSRRHCEFWCQNGRWYIKDVKSSSGTFLNHIRLSAPAVESRPFPVNDGDIVQLGIDFKGGEEMIFRCVKIRIELNRGWQSSLNNFNVKAHKRLRDLQKQGQTSSSGQDCSICLGPVAPCQSLFVAPCSHTWHYKCIRVLINGPQWPQFICPNCRAVADLEAEIDDPDEHWVTEEAEDNSMSLEASAPAPAPAAPTQAPPSAPTAEETNEAEDQVADLTTQNDLDSIDQAFSADQLHSTDRADRRRTLAPPMPTTANGTFADNRQTVLYHTVDSDYDEEREEMDLESPPLGGLAVAVGARAPPNSETRSSESSNASVPPIPITNSSSGLHVPQHHQSRSSGSSTFGNHHGEDSTVVGFNGRMSPDDRDFSAGGPMTPTNTAGPYVFDGGANPSGVAGAIAGVGVNLAALVPQLRNVSDSHRSASSRLSSVSRDSRNGTPDRTATG